MWLCDHVIAIFIAKTKLNYFWCYFNWLGRERCYKSYGLGKLTLLCKFMLDLRATVQKTLIDTMSRRHMNREQWLEKGQVFFSFSILFDQGI